MFCVKKRTNKQEQDAEGGGLFMGGWLNQDWRGIIIVKNRFVVEFGTPFVMNSGTTLLYSVVHTAADRTMRPAISILYGSALSVYVIPSRAYHHQQQQLLIYIPGVW